MRREVLELREQMEGVLAGGGVVASRLQLLTEIDAVNVHVRDPEEESVDALSIGNIKLD